MMLINSTAASHLDHSTQYTVHSTHLVAHLPDNPGEGEGWYQEVGLLLELPYLHEGSCARSVSPMSPIPDLLNNFSLLTPKCFAGSSL